MVVKDIVAFLICVLCGILAPIKLPYLPNVLLF